jgi:hypothetical protein
LVTRLIGEIGYPTADDDERLALLSVEHAGVLDRYRDAHEISLRDARGEASTEQLRQALVHYRTLFAELLGEEPIPKTDEPSGLQPVTSETVDEDATNNSDPTLVSGTPPRRLS